MTSFLRLFFGKPNLLALGALTLTFVPQVSRAQAHCSNATMKGTYIASGTGSVGSGPTFSPIASVSLLIYNGDGTGMSVFGTKTVAGQSSTSSNVPATFTVNPDCTGSKTIGTTNFNFVITPDGSRITWTVTSPGVTLMGTGVRLLYSDPGN
jgi:hypothetical protein